MDLNTNDLTPAPWPVLPSHCPPDLLVGFAGDMKCQPEGLKFDAFGEPRTRYVRVTLNRSHCVMEPSEGDCYVQMVRDSGDPDWEQYIVRDVWLSKREFEDLPEHDGF